MTFDELTATLDLHLRVPQSSERWAMYRLIAPIVDYANQDLGHSAYFEYNQTSSHGRHQSVDIALLDEHGTPVFFVEAKRADRKVSPEQISKYLESDERGIVTNGFIWILCQCETHETVELFSDQLDLGSLEYVIGFIKGAEISGGKVTQPGDSYESQIQPQRITKTIKASRPQHPVSVCSSREELLEFINNGDRRPQHELSLLQAIHDALPTDELDGFPRIEVRKTRISFFDRGRAGSRNRMARIELGKSEPDLLVRTSIVEQHPLLAEIAQPTVHDKGGHMRRFRLSSDLQAGEFGEQLVSVLRKAHTLTNPAKAVNDFNETLE